MMVKILKLWQLKPTRNYGQGDSGRCSMFASERKYSKKHRFHGNQFTDNGTAKKHGKKVTPVSLKKVSENFQIKDN